jgi:peptidyl-prolyl cis-trans isomerase A (cyclophilin A)
MHLTRRGLIFALVFLAMSPEAFAKGKKSSGKSHGSAAKSSAGTQIVFETNRGKFVVRLYDDKAPISSKNMIDYVQAGFYNNTIFHRVIPDFMIQGGGFTKDLVPKPGREPIKNEADNGLSNIRGTVAMARTDVVDSATSQFFINVKDNTQLDHRPGSFGYAVIGEVIEGMDVVDAIRKVPTLCPSWTSDGACDAKLTKNMCDVPKDAVVILKATKRK